MLTNARTLGYVFDPLTVFWCYAADGRLEGVVAEVHNTYGERHGYVVEVDDRGRGQADKAFYVSPFFGVFGSYQLKFTLDGDRVGAFITLRQHDQVVFTASFTGSAVPLTTRRIITSALRHPFMPQRVALLIRLHGVWLWARRLPVVHPTVEHRSATDVDRSGQRRRSGRLYERPGNAPASSASYDDGVGGQVVQAALVTVVDDRRDDQQMSRIVRMKARSGSSQPASDPQDRDPHDELPGRARRAVSRQHGRPRDEDDQRKPRRCDDPERDWSTRGLLTGDRTRPRAGTASSR